MRLYADHEDSHGRSSLLGSFGGFERRDNHSTEAERQERTSASSPHMRFLRWALRSAEKRFARSLLNFASTSSVVSGLAKEPFA
jgi:hypothetical protein